MGNLLDYENFGAKVEIYSQLNGYFMLLSNRNIGHSLTFDQWLSYFDIFTQNLNNNCADCNQTSYKTIGG